MKLYDFWLVVECKCVIHLHYPCSVCIRVFAGTIPDFISLSRDGRLMCIIIYFDYWLTCHPWVIVCPSGHSFLLVLCLFVFVSLWLLFLLCVVLFVFVLFLFLLLFVCCFFCCFLECVDIVCRCFCFFCCFCVFCVLHSCRTGLLLLIVVLDSDYCGV